MSQVLTATERDVTAICDLVSDLCGIYLDDSKGYLVESRLSEIAHKAECSDYVELAQKTRGAMGQQLGLDIIDAITTNETLFYRDQSPFEALQHKTIPELLDAREKSPTPRKLRIWSAACSTGQEAYTIAMVLHDLIPDIHKWDISIQATDISDDAVRRASKGWYAEHEIGRGLPDLKKNRYFHQENNGWRVDDSLRALITFRRLNLLESFSGVGSFDVVFCRNVAIYFTPDDRSKLFHRLADTMPQDGYMFVGSSESLSDLGPRFAPQLHCRSVYYRPNLNEA